MYKRRVSFRNIEPIMGVMGFPKHDPTRESNERLALLFASAQLAADVKTLTTLAANKYTDRSVIMSALEAIDGTRRIVKDALAGKSVVS